MLKPLSSGTVSLSAGTGRSKSRPQAQRGRSQPRSSLRAWRLGGSRGDFRVVEVAWLVGKSGCRFNFDPSANVYTERTVTSRPHLQTAKFPTVGIPRIRYTALLPVPAPDAPVWVCRPPVAAAGRRAKMRMLSSLQVSPLHHSSCASHD